MCFFLFLVFLYTIFRLLTKYLEEPQKESKKNDGREVLQNIYYRLLPFSKGLEGLTLNLLSIKLSLHLYYIVVPPPGNLRHLPNIKISNGFPHHCQIFNLRNEPRKAQGLQISVRVQFFFLQNDRSSKQKTKKIIDVQST